MSTKIMSSCWGLSIPPTAKSVLISLADNANDEGYCWPSISTIAERTCFSERAVQNAIKWLEDASLLKANRDNGRHTTYVVTPAEYSPPQEMHPEGSASPPPQQVRKPPQEIPKPPQEIPKPPQEIPKPPQQVPSNRNKPSRTVNRTTVAFPMPDCVTSQTWNDWMLVRKSKRAAMTQTALDGVIREAKKAGMSLESAILMCVERSWQSFRADWVSNNGKLNGSAEPVRRRNEL